MECMIARCRIILFILLGIFCLPSFITASEVYTLNGRVIDKTTRHPVAHANVSIQGLKGKASMTDSTGYFSIKAVQPGIYRLSVTCVGYATLLSSEYIVSPQMPLIELELEEKSTQLQEVTVRSNSFVRTIDSPVSLQVIGLKDIEKSPGGNRDISRIIRSYPGVSYTVGGYRNDLIVRGGAPSENRFYLDGVEIPNINHFATQGASGGAVSILNADMIREVQFYSGAFPVNESGALSSVMDIRLRNGSADKQSFKATIGASEFAFSGSGHFKGNTTYLFSVRRSYLQLLFKMFGLPFLPGFIDGQFKVKTRITPHDEITFVGLTGIDDMKLNKDQKGEDAEYILSYLPHIKQQTFTVGTVYKHYAGRSIRSVTLGYNYLRNSNLKYTNNDESSEDNKILDLQSTEQKVSLKLENTTNTEHWMLIGGVEGYYSHYYNSTFQRMFSDSLYITNYLTRLGIVGWGAFASARYKSADERFFATVGLRLDGCNYSTRMSELWRYVSPRLSLSYRLKPSLSLKAGAGIFYQLPSYTSLGFKSDKGVLLNKQLSYIRVKSGNVGIEYNKEERLILSVEGFYKYYDKAPLSVSDQIPLACKGNDYGIVGDELLIPSASGKAYGVEASLRWQIPSKFNMVSSLTLYKSEYRNTAAGAYISSAWDNRFIVNVFGTYNLSRNWSIGAKLSAIGGAPYTPYDVDKSSLVEAWNVKGRPYFDYAQYNQRRLKTYAQLDIRIDKSYYFRKWMLGFYLDVQNLTKSTFRNPDVLMSTGVIENPQDVVSQQRYQMKYIKQESKSILPTIGVTLGF